MYILISPAKTMKEERRHTPQGLPVLLEKSKLLHKHLMQMDVLQMKSLMKINDKLAIQNVERFANMRFDKAGICALDAYDGIQFKAMQIEQLGEEEWQYLNHHLRILSGFYGIVRPSDSIYPYRLEMQSRFVTEDSKNLYDFWKDTIAKELPQEEFIIKLASKEYDKSVRSYISKERFIDIIFYIKENDKLITRSTQIKQARGRMVNFMAKHKVENLEELTQFAYDGYQYHAELSNDTTFVFVKEEL